MRRALGLCILITGCSIVTLPVDRSDPRFHECGADAFEPLAAFALIASDYKSHFPHMGLAPELDVDEPAFAVVFAEGDEPAVALAPRPRGPGEAQLKPRGHSVCIYVGHPPRGVANHYGGVDISGMRP